MAFPNIVETTAVIHQDGPRIAMLVICQQTSRRLPPSQNHRHPMA